MSKIGTPRAAIYLRISLDQTGEGLAIQRQREDCRRIIKERGWTLIGEYSDEVPSNAKRKRPAYNEMVRAYESGQFDALVCWDLDRLTRQPRELEDWIDAAEDKGLALVTANGEADLTTDGGRMYARVKVAVAKAEMERKAARQRRSAKQRSELGRPPLGVRLMGYTPKGELVPDEAKAVRAIFRWFHRGESLRSITRLLMEQGVETRNGAAWNPSTIRGILVNPRYAGRAVYQGEVTGQPGGWKPLVSDDVFDTIQATLTDERRKTNRVGTDRKHLGSGVYLCGVCGEPCSSWSGGRYRCKEAHINRAMRQVDDFVLAVVSERIQSSRKGIAAKVKASSGPSADLMGELNALRDRKRRTESDYDSDLIDGRRFKSKMEQIDAEMRAVEQRFAASSRNTALAAIMAADDPCQAFLDASVMAQRSIIGALVEVRLHKGHHGVKLFDPATVEITPL